MDDSSTADVGKSDRRIPLGMHSFGQQEREQCGQNIRLAMECVEGNDQRLHEQFVQQQHAADISQFDVEKTLRNDRESFNTVRTLSPESYRFRVVDAQGRDIHNQPDSGISDNGTRSTFDPDDYTHVYSGEPVPDYCQGRERDRVRDRHTPSFTSEAPAYYAATNARWVPDTLCH